jgi:RNA polymerase sigma-70 factor (ECF subfamily)
MPPHPDDGSPPQPGEVTRLLGALAAGKDGAADRVIEMVYAELKGLADGALRSERDDHTLQPTALVHEAWVKLSSQDAVVWQNRSHFLGIASLAMRRVLVDHARMRKRDKRGGGARREELVTEFSQEAGPLGKDLDVLALHEGLDQLKAHSERAAKVVELRFFAGLTEEETAEVLGVTRPTVTRDWRAARAWLATWMSDGEDA